MALLEINRNPGKKELLVFGLGLPVVFGLVGWHRLASGSPVAAQVVWVFGGLLTAVFALVPAARSRIYVAWMVAVSPIAFVVSHVILGLVYFLVFTPVALLLRVMGRDPMKRRFDRTASSYWISRETARTKSSYFRQF